ncbi:LPS translocon maturation chaperone LptM [Rhodanobacter sp. BL-MT-08]
MHRLISVNSLFLVAFCIVAGTLAGCGQKGPLYLPPATKPVPASPASTVKPQQPAITGNNAIPDNQRPDSTQY